MSLEHSFVIGRDYTAIIKDYPNANMSVTVTYQGFYPGGHDVVYDGRKYRAFIPVDSPGMLIFSTNDLLV